MSAVRVFEAAARRGSFTRAAEELGMTQAAVSYQIKLLEERVGTALFRRFARHVGLTAAGQRLAPAVSEAFGLLGSAFAELSEARDNILSITVLHTFAAVWLAPRIGGFQLAHPNLAVKLDTSAELQDLQSGAFDMGVRVGDGSWPGLEAHLLMPGCYTPLASPKFLAAHPLERPQDLLRAPLIGDRGWWRTWLVEAGVSEEAFAAQHLFEFEVQAYEVSAAMEGHVVAIASPIMFAREIADGRLVQPFEHVTRDARAYYLAYPAAQRRAPKIAAFRAWILAQAHQQPAPAAISSAGR